MVSAADPKRTLALCDPVELGPTMLWRAGNIRQPGATAKVNLALSGLPAFHEDPERMQGRIVIGPSIDYVEKASDARKYGELRRGALDRGDDPVARGSLARARRAGT